MVDGFGWPFRSITDLGWQKCIKYRYGPGFFDASVPIIVNQDRWNKLGTEQRQCLQDMATWLDKTWPKWREGESAKRRKLQLKAGIEFVNLRDDFARMAYEIYWAVLEKADPEFIRKIKPLLSK